jgi:hypothetical protein
MFPNGHALPMAPGQKADARSVARVLIVVLAIAAVPAVIRAVSYPDYPGTDDSFIHAAIIENLRAGRGWGINPHEPVNLSTSPLFTILMRGVASFVPDIIAAGSVITTLAVVLGVLGTSWVGMRITGEAAMGLLAAAIAAANVHLWRWTGTFIEAPLGFAGVIAILVAFLPLYVSPLQRPLHARFFALGLSIGVLSLLRFECGLLGLGFLAHHLVNDRRHLIGRYACAALGVIVPLALWAAAAWIMFGSILPTTLSAKTTAGLVLVNPALARQLASVLAPGFGAAFLLFALALAVLVAGRQSAAIAEAGRRSVLFATFLVAVIAFYYLKTDSLQSPARYLLPVMAVLPLAAIPFVAAAWRSLAPSARVAVFGLLALQFAVALAINHLRVAPVLARMKIGYVAAMGGAAEELNRRCGGRDVVLVHFDIGVLSYRHNHRCRIADSGALASPELRGLSIAEKVAAVRPRFVVESLGDPARSDITAVVPDAVLLWSRPFQSHSVGEPDRRYTVRLFELPARQ